MRKGALSYVGKISSLICLLNSLICTLLPDLCLTYVSNGNFAKEKLITEKGEQRQAVQGLNGIRF